MMGAINDISFTFPPFSPLTQPEEVGKFPFCDVNNKPDSCKGKKICPCVHRLKVKLNSVVTIVVVDETDGKLIIELTQSNFIEFPKCRNQSIKSSFSPSRLSTACHLHLSRESSSDGGKGHKVSIEPRFLLSNTETVQSKTSCQRHNFNPLERFYDIQVQGRQSWLVAAALPLW